MATLLSAAATSEHQGLTGIDLIAIALVVTASAGAVRASGR
ncbi:hypothetical protein [Streptomyces sp. NPDC001843]